MPGPDQTLSVQRPDSPFHLFLRHKPWPPLYLPPHSQARSGTDVPHPASCLQILAGPGGPEYRRQLGFPECSLHHLALSFSCAAVEKGSSPRPGSGDVGGSRLVCLIYPAWFWEEGLSAMLARLLYGEAGIPRGSTPSDAQR